MNLSCQLFQRKHKRVRKSVFGHCYWFFTLCASGHKTQNLQNMLFRDQDRVRVGFTRCGFDKVLKMFSFVTNPLIGQHFSELCHHKNCTHDEKMAQLIWNKQLFPDIRILVLNWVGYLRSGFAHVLPAVSGSSVFSNPNTNHTKSG